MTVLSPRPLLMAALALCLFVTASCSQPSAPDTTASRVAVEEPDEPLERDAEVDDLPRADDVPADDEGHDDSRDAENDRGTTRPDGSTRAESDTDPARGSDPKGGDRQPAGPPEPLDFPHRTTVDVRASVTPRCVVRGASVTLQVESEPEASVAYHARYFGDEGGSDPPWGHGHGGNDAGDTSPTGTYASTWVVSPSTPTGEALVDVVVAWRGEWGYQAPTFRVVTTPNQC